MTFPAGSTRLRLVLLCAAGLALVSCAVSVFTISRDFEGGITYEFCHYAEIGRNILEGKGYRTSMVFPATLAYLDQRGIAFDAGHPAPVLDRFPLQAYLTAAAMALAGKDDASVAALSLLTLAACVGLTFVAGCLFFSPMEGAAAAALLAFDPSFQRGFVLWGLPDFGFCFLVLSTGVLLCRQERSPRHLVLAGAVGGLAWLARSNAMIWVPLLVAAAARPIPRVRSAWRSARRDNAPGTAREEVLLARGATLRAAWFLAGMLVVSAPAWIYNLRWFGAVTPPTLAWDLGHRASQGGFPALDYKTVSVFDILRHHFPALARKFWIGLRLYLGDLPSLWQMQLVWPLAIFGFPSLSGGGRRLARLTLAMFALQLLVFSAIRYEALGHYVRGRYFLWFAPAILLAASHGAAELGRRFKVGAWGLAQGRPPLRGPDAPMGGASGLAVWTALNLAFFGHFLLPPKDSWTHPTQLDAGHWPEIAAAASAAGPGGLVVSNLPAQIAWYGRRPAVSLPAGPEDLLAIDRRHPVAAVLISRVGVGELSQTPVWRRMIDDRRELDAFCRAHGFVVTHNDITAVLLVRKTAQAARFP